MSVDVLRWSGRILTLRDLEFSLNGHQEILISPGTIVSPVVRDTLAHRKVKLQEAPYLQTEYVGASWTISWDRHYALLTSAIDNVRKIRSSIISTSLIDDNTLGWVARTSSLIAQRKILGAIVFCQDAMSVSCLANKHPGIRSVSLTSPLQMASASLNIAPNLVAVEMPGRTYHEMKTIIEIASQPLSTLPTDFISMIEKLES